MQVPILILKSFFFLVATLTTVLVGVSFSKTIRERYPWLRKLDGKKHIMVIVIIITTALGWTLQSVIEILDLTERFETIYLPDGERKEKATLKTFEEELKNESEKIVLRAREYFKIGEAMLNDKNYAGAIDYYKKSVGVIPTMSGFLNLAISSLLLYDYNESEKATFKGLQLSRNNKDLEFEAIFLNLLGIIYRRQGKLNDAERVLNQAINLNIELKRLKAVATNYNNLGNVLSNKGNHNQALTYHLKSLGIDKDLNDGIGKAVSLSNIGNVYRAFGKLDSAVVLFSEALQLFREQNLEKGKADVLTNLGLVDYDRGILKSAISHFNDAFRIHLHLNDLKGQAIDLKYIGIIMRDQRNFDSSLVCLSKSLKLFETLTSCDKIVDISNILGTVYSEKHDFEKAEMSYNLALNKSRECDNISDGEILNNIGIVFQDQGKLDEAIRYFYEAIQSFIPKNNKLGIYYTYGNIGHTYYLLGQYDSSYAYFQSAVIGYQAIGHAGGKEKIIADELVLLGWHFSNSNKYNKAEKTYMLTIDFADYFELNNQKAKASLNLGVVYFEIGRYDDAIDFYKSSLSIYTKVNDLKGQAMSLSNLGNALLRKKMYEQSLDYQNQALKLFGKLNDVTQLAQIYRNIANVHYELRKFNDALRFYQLSLNNLNNSGRRYEKAITHKFIGLSYIGLGIPDSAYNSFTKSYKLFSLLNMNSEAMEVNKFIKSLQH